MKFLGILYLLIWHSGIKGLNIVVISFFLQLFFFISGYFYREQYTEEPFMLIRKRLVSLYIPYVAYCFVFLVLNNLLVDIFFYPETMFLSGKQFLVELYYIMTLGARMQLAGAMWFVSALFIASIMFCCISALLKKIVVRAGDDEKMEYIRFVLILTLFLLGNYLAREKIFLPRYVDISLVLMFFYYLGFLYKKHEQKIPMNIFFALIALLILFLCAQYGYPQFVQRKYVNPAFILVTGVAGIYFTLYLSKAGASLMSMSFIDYAGSNTMVILALHFLAFKIVSVLYIFANDLPRNLLVSFPFIRASGQGYRWLYVAGGLLMPLAVKYALDTGVRKIKRLIA